MANISLNDTIYITIPQKYKSVYEGLLVAAVKYGDGVVKKCNNNYNVLSECFNLFNSVVAAYSLNQYDLADELIDFIKDKLKANRINIDDVLIEQEETPDNIFKPVFDILISLNKISQPITMYSNNVKYVGSINVTGVNEIEVSIPSGKSLYSYVLTSNGLDMDITNIFVDNKLIAKFPFDESVLTITLIDEIP